MSPAWFHHALPLLQKHPFLAHFHAPPPVLVE